MAFQQGTSQQVYSPDPSSHSRKIVGTRPCQAHPCTM